MGLQIACQHCHKPLRLADGTSGYVQCGHCKKTFPVAAPVPNSTHVKQPSTFDPPTAPSRLTPLDDDAIDIRRKSRLPWLGDLGVLLMVGGGLALVASLKMDTSVPVPGEAMRVHNIGLMQAQHIYVILTALAIVAGLACFIVSRYLEPDRADGKRPARPVVLPAWANVIIVVFVGSVIAFLLVAGLLHWLGV